MLHAEFLWVVDGDRACEGGDRASEGGPRSPASPSAKRALIEFHPEEPPEKLALFSDASAAHLVPVLRAALAKLEAGDLRIPVAGGLRWVDDEA